MRLEYTKAHHLATLHDELIAAGVIPTYLGDKPGTAWGIELDVPDGTAEQTVAAVVAAHDRAAAQAAWDAARQAESDDETQARQAVEALTGAIDGPAPTTVAQVWGILRPLLRIVRALVRLQLRRL